MQCKYSMWKDVSDFQWYKSSYSRIAQIVWWYKSSYSRIAPSGQKGVWWCPLDQSHQWRGQRKLPYLLPNISRNFGEIIGGFLEVGGNSWRICRGAGREEREGLAMNMVHPQKNRSKCIKSTAVYPLLSTACSTIHWIKVDFSMVHCNITVPSRQWIIALVL